MESWLNDTSLDGFLGNLGDYDKYIVTDYKWNATSGSNDSKPPATTMVTDAVGLLNQYEYVTSSKGTTTIKGYLNNGLWWWLLNSSGRTSTVRNVRYDAEQFDSNTVNSFGVRSSINLKSNVQIVDGDGTMNNPYRLKGDNDKKLAGTKLSSRYSGEYIRFGTGENNIYRIVSHETPTLTKITSAEPLKNSGKFKIIAFGSNTTWYLGTVEKGKNYKLAKYTDDNMSGLISNTSNSKVGLLRVGELMMGQFTKYTNKGTDMKSGLTTDYWTLTPYDSYDLRQVVNYGSAPDSNVGGKRPANTFGIKPALNLKSNVIITSGEGTKEKPFEITLES